MLLRDTHTHKEEQKERGEERERGIIIRTGNSFLSVHSLFLSLLFSGSLYLHAFICGMSVSLVTLFCVVFYFYLIFPDCVMSWSSIMSCHYCSVVTTSCLLLILFFRCICLVRFSLLSVICYVICVLYCDSFSPMYACLFVLCIRGIDCC